MRVANPFRTHYALSGFGSGTMGHVMGLVFFCMDTLYSNCIINDDSGVLCACEYED